MALRFLTTSRTCALRLIVGGLDPLPSSSRRKMALYGTVDAMANCLYGCGLISLCTCIAL